MKYFSSILSLLLMMTILTSCDPQSCEDIDCGPYKNCVNSECVCPQGLEGDACEIYSYEKYVGYYQVSENCTSTTAPPNGIYNITIIQGNDIDKIVFTNFNNSGLSVEGVINGNYLSIPEQNVGSFTVDGGGEYNPVTNSLTIEYNLTQGSNYSGCTAVYSKL
jgi:hypothetical protein